jgi:hypothetical protein
MILTVIKKNLLSIICAIVALTAVGMQFYFSSWITQMQDKLNARQTTYQKLEKLSKGQRTLPILDPNSSEAAPLNVFPNDEIIKSGGEVTDKVAQESKAVLDRAVALNKHDVLLPGILPNNSSDAMGVKFQQEYADAMDYGTPEHRATSLPVKIAQAGTPPSDAEIDAAKDQKKNELEQLIQRDQAGNPFNKDEIDQEITKETTALPGQLRARAAHRFKVYIDADAIKMATNIAGRTTPEATAVFNAQVGMWMVQDMLQAVAEANAQSDSVLDSPVKRILRFTYPDEPLAKIGMSQPGSGNAGPSGPNGPNGPGPESPPPMAGGEGTPLHKNPMAGPAGRVSNFMYDVVPFELRMDVRESDLPRVLALLSKGRFINVSKVDVMALDATPLAATGYFYGSQPVVRVNVQGEEYFMRRWLVPLMPDRILAALGIHRDQGPPGA